MVRRSKVFLVDDHPVFLRGMSALIGPQRTLVVCGLATDRIGALRGIAASAPDLVIVDLNLNHSSGLELLKDLAIQHPGLRCLVVSASAQTDHARRALRAGARGYVVKTEATDVLVPAIHAVLAGRHYVTPAIATGLAMAHCRKVGERECVEAFSDRERETFTLLGEGGTLRFIASILGVSVDTVHTFCRRMCEKLGLVGERELLIAAVRWRERNMPRL